MISNDPPSDISAIVDRHRALAVLRLLAGDDLRGAANEAVLSEILTQMALGGSEAKIRACLEFLDQRGLLSTAWVNGLLVVQLAKRGSEVAQGLERVEGVEPYSIGCPY